MINANVIDDLKGFDWQFIVDYGNSLTSFDDAQWRFLKGLIAELAIEENSEPTLTYVGAHHKDYDWHKYNMSVELKSQLSASMYTKKGGLRKSYEIKLNNTNGTNKNSTLPESHVADLLIVVRNDGAFVIDKATVMRYAVKQGDGFSVKVPNDAVEPVSGLIVTKNTYNNRLQEYIMEAIKNDIRNAKAAA